jgi:hypothetical protein
MFSKCAITGYPLNQGEIQPFLNQTIEYETKYVGKVKITLSTYEELLNNVGKFPVDLIGGICKERTLKNEDPILIDSNFIREGYKKYNPPTHFDEKCNALVRNLFKLGGEENKEFELNPTSDFTLAFSFPEEFSRIVDQLESDYYISIKKIHKITYGIENRIFSGTKMTNLGKEHAKKYLPKMPLFGLVSQEIITGNLEIDEKINHARGLFFDNPQTMDKMRSACETLSYVLEPLREDLKTIFSSKDVSDFFQLVNTFDIRHNKDATKSIVIPEQLEWVFYTLLNTINTYYKIKNKGI